MTSTTKTKNAFALIAGLSLVGALASCSAPVDTPTPDVGTDSGSETETDAPAGEYADGTYSATGDYQAPSGTETVEVTITLADGVISDVEVVGEATDPQAKLMQGEFIAGIDAVVVGKSLDEIQVDKVGGSSLTSGGFNAAVETIKADAAA